MRRTTTIPPAIPDSVAIIGGGGLDLDFPLSLPPSLPPENSCEQFPGMYICTLGPGSMREREREREGERGMIRQSSSKESGAIGKL